MWLDIFGYVLMLSILGVWSWLAYDCAKWLYKDTIGKHQTEE